MAHVLSLLQEHSGIPAFGGVLNIVPKYRYVFVPVDAMTGWAAALVGAGTGSPIIGECTTSSLAGLRIQADADSMATLLHFPDDVDVEREIAFRMWWSSNQTTVADEYTWTMTYTEMALNGTSDMNAAGATALDTVWVADANLVTADALQATEWGMIAAGTLSASNIPLNVLLTATTNGGTVSSDLVIWWGLQYRYYPKKF